MIDSINSRVALFVLSSTGENFPKFSKWYLEESSKYQLSFIPYTKLFEDLEFRS